MRLLYLILPSIVCTTSLLHAQSNKIIDPNKSTQLLSWRELPLEREEVYRTFFKHIQLLDQVADELDKKKESGKDVRRYFQTNLNLSDRETALLKRAAQECELDLLGENEKSLAFIESSKLILSKGTPSNIDKTSLRDTAKKLASERLDAITRCINLLEIWLGAESFQKIDTYVRIFFVRSITVTPLPSLKVTALNTSPVIPNGGGEQ